MKDEIYEKLNTEFPDGLIEPDDVESINALPNGEIVSVKLRDLTSQGSEVEAYTKEELDKRTMSNDKEIGLHKGDSITVEEFKSLHGSSTENIDTEEMKMYINHVLDAPDYSGYVADDAITPQELELEKLAQTPYGNSTEDIIDDPEVEYIECEESPDTNMYKLEEHNGILVPEPIIFYQSGTATEKYHNHLWITTKVKVFSTYQDVLDHCTRRCGDVNDICIVEHPGSRKVRCVGIDMDKIKRLLHETQMFQDDIISAAGTDFMQEVAIAENKMLLDILSGLSSELNQKKE